MRKILTMMTLCAIAGISLNVNLKSGSVSANISEVTLANVEALARAEDPNVICYFGGSIDCPISRVKVLYVRER